MAELDNFQQTKTSHGNELGTHTMGAGAYIHGAKCISYHG